MLKVTPPSEDSEDEAVGGGEAEDISFSLEDLSQSQSQEHDDGAGVGFHL